MAKKITPLFDIKKKSVCIIGCGGLGCNVSVHLAGAGIGRLFLCDFDCIEESNLNRQFLYTFSDIGKSKCRTMKERLSAYAPQAEITAVEKKICGENDLAYALGCDTVILAVDNNETRAVVNAFCLHNRIPVIDGGISGCYGRMYFCIPQKTPCLFCSGMISENGKTVSVSSTAGIIGSLEASAAIRYLSSGDESMSGKIYVYDGDRFDTLCVRPSAECGFCREISE